MGRISKRNKDNIEKMANGGAGGRKANYQVGIYARLSSNQDKKENQKVTKNESIEIQIDIAEKFVQDFNSRQKEESMHIVGHYKDLGKTGTNFDRDEFQRLLQDIRVGDINCVIVKDLSRFGRNYLEAGNYIEKIFPFLGVRFIAVTDGYDSGAKGNETKQMASEIKNLVHDMYAKDFSVKAKLHLKQRRQEGSYVGGPPPYGYQTVWEGKIRKLIPDENTLEIVRMIYQKFLETQSYATVVGELNQSKINPPAIYKETGEVYWQTGGESYKGWEKDTVRRMLQNKAYIGTLTQGKTEITARNEKNRIWKKEQDWVIQENAHDFIIPRGQYEQAQDIIEQMRQELAGHKNQTAGCPLEENLFDTVLYCGVCGRKMTRSSYVQHYADKSKSRLDGYFCLNAGSTKVDTCPTSNRISKRELLDLLFPLIKMEFRKYLGKSEKFVEIGKEQVWHAQKKLEEEIRETKCLLQRGREEELLAYQNYREGTIPQKEYVACKLKQKEKGKQLESRGQELEKTKKQLSSGMAAYEKKIRSLIQLRKQGTLSKDMIEALIQKIYVYPGKRVEVVFSYMEEWGEYR